MRETACDYLIPDDFASGPSGGRSASVRSFLNSSAAKQNKAGGKPQEADRAPRLLAGRSQGRASRPPAH